MHRSIHGEASGPIEKVERDWELVTYHDPKRGRLQVTFKTIRNQVVLCKKKIIA